MHDKDRDLHELERLLGHTKPGYLVLRHEKELRAGSASRKPTPRFTHIAAAAAILAVITAVGFGTLEPGSWGTSKSKSRMAMPAPGAKPLSLRPMGKLKATASFARPRVTASFRAPRRPSAKKG
ncbi:MAG: hypothetical protein AAF557_02495 [Pseudomonadota bacterium]